MDDPRSFFDDSEQRKDDDGRDEEADQDEGGAARQDVGGRFLLRRQRRDRPRRRRRRRRCDASAAVGLHHEAELADADVEGVRRVALVEAFRRERTFGRLELIKKQFNDNLVLFVAQRSKNSPKSVKSDFLEQLRS